MIAHSLTHGSLHRVNCSSQILSDGARDGAKNGVLVQQT